MRIRVVRQSVLMACAVVTAAVIAAGCGGSESGAAASARAMEYVPQRAVMYFVLDTDFGGANWDRMNQLGSQFKMWDDLREELIKEVNGGTGDVTYRDDIKPWLGKTAVAAVFNVDYSGDASEMVLLMESTDDAQAEASLKQADGTSSAGSVQGAKLYKRDDMYWSVNDGTVLLASNKKSIATALKTKKSGTAITDDESTGDVAKEISQDAVLSMVIGKDGLRAALKDARKDSQRAADVVNSSELITAFEGFALGLEATKDGMRAHGVARFDKDKLQDSDMGKDAFEPTMFDMLPESTLAAYTNRNLGSTIKKIVDAATKEDSATAGSLAQAEAALGLSVDDVADAYDDSFALAVNRSKTNAGGGNMGVTLLMEHSSDKAAETTDKLIGLTALTGSAGTKSTINGNAFTAFTVSGTQLVAGVMDDMSVVSTDPDYVAQIGTGRSLTSSALYKGAVEAANLPKKVDALMYLDPAGLSQTVEQNANDALGKLTMGKASTEKSAKTALDSLDGFGPWLVWVTSDSSSTTLDVFMQVKNG